MQKLKFNGHVIECFDSIQDVDIIRYQKFNLNLLIDAGIGSDLNSIGQRVGAVKKLMATDQKKANIELDNMFQSIAFVMKKLSPKYRAFVCTIKSIDGYEIKTEDLTESGIDEIIQQLGKKRLSFSLLNDVVFSIKKKFDGEFETFFPELVNVGASVIHYQHLKDRTVLMLKKLTEKSKEAAENIEKQISKIDQFFVESIRPKVYHGSKGFEVQMISNFENTCTMLEFHNFTNNAKGLKTIEFYQKLVALKTLLKKNQNKK